MKKIKTGFLGVMMIMFCMCMMVMTPNTAYAALATESNADSIQDLLSEIGELNDSGNAYELTVTNVIEIDDGNEYEVDLNGNKVIFDASGSEKAHFYVSHGTLTISNGTIVEKDGYAAIKMTGKEKNDKDDYSRVVIEETATIIGDDGILLRPLNSGCSYGMSVVMNGTINAANAGINVNGSNVPASDEDVCAYIEVNGEINASGGADKGVGIYLAGYADTTIEEQATITGVESGIEIRAGKLAVTKGATITGTYESFVSTPNNNGSEVKGAGIAVVPHKDNGSSRSIEVEINEAILSGYYPIYKENDPAVTMRICGAICEIPFDVTYDNVVYIGDEEEAFDVTLNLNGKTITFSKEAREGKVAGFVIENGFLNIIGEGTIKEEEPYYAPIMLKGGSPDDGYSSVVSVGENVTLEGWAGVFVRQNASGVAYGVEADIYGTIKSVNDTANASGIGVNINGSITGEDADIPHIRIYETAKIESTGVGIFVGGNALVEVYGGEISGGESAIEIRAGILEVSDGTITSNYSGPELICESNPNGSTTYGAGIAVTQHTTELPVEVIITDGEIRGIEALYVANPENNTDFEDEVTVSVSGGTFSTEPEAKYLADGYIAVESGNDYIVVEEGSYTILLNKTTANVYPGSTLQLTATTNPTGQSVTWSSSNTDVATVDATGLVTVNAASGTATITAAVENGSEAATCTITVVAQELNKTTLSLAEGSTETLTVNGEGTTVWSSSDETIATVDQNGVVTAIKAGVAKIKAYINNLVELFCDVTVTATSSSAPSGSDDSYYEDDYVYESAGSSTTASKAPAEEKSVIIVDEKKGIVNTETGIVTGEGENYSKWIAETTEDGTTAWKFEYAGGTMAAGTVKTNADGETYNQPTWEQINGAWFAFDTEGYATSGWLYDPDMAGWFYIDINQGMLTGWQLIDGKWYFLQTWSDGSKGIMHANTWIDGWYVDASGAWDGKAQV